MPPSDLPALHTFAAVARHGSFRKAARDLDVSPSAVSHAVSGLERRLGLRLLHRTTRNVGLTQEGRVLLSGLSPALERIDAALDAARGVGPGLAGSLRIAAPDETCASLLLPLVLAFRARFPEVEVTLVGTEGAREGADFTVRGADAASEAEHEGCLALGHGVRRLLVAAPAYRDTHGLPADPDALSRHVCIGCTGVDGTIRPWELRRGGARLPCIPEARLVLGSARLVRAAVLAGAGIGQGTEPDLRADLEAERLVEVLPGWAAPPEKCFLCWPQGALDRPAPGAFVDFVRRAGETVLAWQGGREG